MWLALLRTLFSRFLFILFLLVILIPFLLCLLIPRRWIVDNRLFMALSRVFYWVTLKLSFLPITYKGLSNVPKSPCIIVANHQSSFDIPLIGYATRKRPHIWLALSQLLDMMFFLKFFLPRIAVLVDTSAPVKGLRTLVQAINLIKSKPWNLIIFPEGGRFTDGTVHKFMDGFALIARKTNRPVVPMKIIGVDKVYPPNSFIVYWHPITVVIGQPFEFLENETDAEFSKRVYDWFVSTKD